MALEEFRDKMRKLILLGDSTCASKKKEARPETGWGEAFFQFLSPSWILCNNAFNGYSTVSCLKSGVFSKSLLDSKEGDSVIIQFGHNDQKTDERGTKPFEQYVANLKYMATEFKKRGVSVYFITSIPRRIFENGRLVDTHKDYIAGMKYAGYLSDTPVIDITIPLMLDLTLLGEEESKKYYMNFPPSAYPNYPEGKEDNTHLRPEGALWVSRTIYDSLKQFNSDFLC